MKKEWAFCITDHLKYFVKDTYYELVNGMIIDRFGRIKTPQKDFLLDNFVMVIM